MRNILSRKPNAAGTLYAADADQLKAEITHILSGYTGKVSGEYKIVIAPQGKPSDWPQGYANTYKPLEGKSFDQVVIIAYSEAEYFNEMAVFNGDQYETPLGPIAIDNKLREEFADEDDDFFISSKGHFNTDSFIELQLPFLQTVLKPGFRIVPIIIGHQSRDFCLEMASAISELMYHRNALLVVAADLVHKPEQTESERESLLNDVKQNLLTRQTDPFFNHQWRRQFHSGGYGVLPVAFMVAQKMRVRLQDDLIMQTIDETWGKGQFSVTYFSGRFA